MKLSDFLFNIGRPVAFYPGLVKTLGSMKQAVFVCQMAYWKDKGTDPNGWIYKTSEEIEEETALTYKEQTRVRADLVEIKALEERYARTEHQMYFRINWEIIDTLWNEHLTNGHMPKRKVASSQKKGGILPKVSSLNSNTENTTENTHGVDVLSADDTFMAFEKLKEKGRNRTNDWMHRDKFPEPLLELADKCVERFGEPSKKDLIGWIFEIGCWQSAGCTLADWEAAVKIVNKYTTPVLSVHGMTKAIKFAAQERRNHRTDELPPEYRPMPEDPNKDKYVPNPSKKPKNKNAPAV